MCVWVYHHCLFGTRYDFLCANYTAFDQTLFNCNFVSNVDCVNSKNFWHRNDELYVTQSTTTPAPVVYNFHTQAPPQGYPLTASPIGQTIPQQLPPVVVQPVEARRRPRPAVRRRPQYDYYDDEDYEDLPRTVMMNRRKRPRPRPVYYDEYEEFEDDRFDRRGGGRRRRPYDRRPMRRDPDRRRGYDDEEEDGRFADFTLGKKQKENKPRKYLQDYDEDDERLEKRRPHTRRDEKPTRKTNKRPIDDDYEDYEDTNSKSTTNYNKRQEPKKAPRLGIRRPPSEHFEDDLQQADDSPSSERTRKSNKESTYKKPPEDTRAIIKPVSGTIYDIPRVAPRINLPVPKNAANKFAYKSIATQAPAVQSEEEYDEDDEEEELILKPVKTSSTTEKESISGTHTRPKNTGVRSGDSRRTKNQNSETSTTITSSTTTDLVTEKPAVVRKYKRPFLPSRGGSPYAARNLQPVGEKAIVPAEEANSDFEDDDEIQEGKPDKKPAPVRVREGSPDNLKVTPFRIKVPVRFKSTTEPQELNEADILNENYDEILNEAISPVLPHRDYPTGFSSSSDYAYNNRFQRPSKYVYLDPLVTADGSLYVK